MPQYLRPHISIALLALFLAYGCAPPPYDDSPPAGWEGDSTMWWRSGIDTTGIFRNLETLEDLGVEDASPVYAADGALSRNPEDVFLRFKWSVKKRLLPLLRNEPEVVDSLFEQYWTPQIRNVEFTLDAAEDVKAFTQRVAKHLHRNHFQGPQPQTTLGVDVPIDYPDSLQSQRIGAKVRLQVYLNENGEPQAITFLEGGHHVLNNRAMLATTQMKWREAFLFENKEWMSIPSWVRHNVHFNVPPE